MRVRVISHCIYIVSLWTCIIPWINLYAVPRPWGINPPGIGELIGRAGGTESDGDPRSARLRQIRAAIAIRQIH